MSTFNKYPEIVVSQSNEFVWEGYENILQQLDQEKKSKGKVILTIDCYPGVNMEELRKNLISPLQPTETFFLDDLYYSSEKITEMIQYNLTDDRVFGIFSA